MNTILAFVAGTVVASSLVIQWQILDRIYYTSGISISISGVIN